MVATSCEWRRRERNQQKLGVFPVRVVPKRVERAAVDMYEVVRNSAAQRGRVRCVIDCSNTQNVQEKTRLECFREYY